MVKADENGELSYKDEFTWEEAMNSKDNRLETVFKDGTLLKEQSLAGIRKTLHNGNF